MGYLGGLIRISRIEKGLSMKELGNKIGVSAASISRYELGQREISNEIMQAISNVLEIPSESITKASYMDWQNKINKIGRTIVDPDDAEILEHVAPKLSKLDSLTKEEEALKTLLNLKGYDFIKTNGNYFFTFKSGGAEISANDLQELLNCAQNGLALAAKSLELRLMHEAFNHSDNIQISSPTPDKTPPEGNDPTQD